MNRSEKIALRLDRVELEKTQACDDLAKVAARVLADPQNLDDLALANLAYQALSTQARCLRRMLFVARAAELESTAATKPGPLSSRIASPAVEKPSR